MNPTVSQMSNYREVVVLPAPRGAVVFLRTQGFGRKPRRAHELFLDCHADAQKFAIRLANNVGCRVIDLLDGEAMGNGDGDKAHG